MPSSAVVRFMLLSVDLKAALSWLLLGRRLGGVPGPRDCCQEQRACSSRTTDGTGGAAGNSTRISTLDHKINIADSTAPVVACSSSSPEDCSCHFRPAPSATLLHPAEPHTDDDRLTMSVTCHAQPVCCSCLWADVCGHAEWWGWAYRTASAGRYGCLAAAGQMNGTNQPGQSRGRSTCTQQVSRGMT